MSTDTADMLMSVKTVNMLMSTNTVDMSMSTNTAYILMSTNTVDMLMLTSLVGISLSTKTVDMSMSPTPVDVDRQRFVLSGALWSMSISHLPFGEPFPLSIVSCHFADCLYTCRQGTFDTCHHSAYLYI